MAKKIIIVGSGAAGMTAASSARATDPSAEITLLTEDTDIAYSPCVIPWVLEGKASWEGMIMHTPEFYRTERDIDVRTRTRVESADGEARTVTAGGMTYSYDALVLATGGKVFIPPVPGADLEGVFSVRTVRDGRRIEAALKDAGRAVIAGAGVIGLELASAFAGLGKEVTVIEMMDQAVPRIADGDMAAPVQALLEEKGVRFVMGAPVEAVLGNGRVTGVRAGGEDHVCDMVVFATGVRADLDLVRQLGLDVGQLGGAVVAPTMQAYRRGRLVPDIYLAGDVIQNESAVMPGPTMSQLGSSAVREGRVAGINAAGGRALAGPTAGPWVSVIGGLQLAGTGLSQGLASWYGIETVSGKATGSTRARYYPGGSPLTVKLTADRVSRRIIGAQVLAGEDATGRINWLTAVITEGVTADDFLVRAENAYCPPTSMVQDVAIKAAEDLCRRLNQ